MKTILVLVVAIIIFYIGYKFNNKNKLTVDPDIPLPDPNEKWYFVFDPCGDSVIPIVVESDIPYSVTTKLLKAENILGKVLIGKIVNASSKEMFSKDGYVIQGQSSVDCNGNTI